MNNLLDALLEAIRDAGTIMSEFELAELAYGVYGETIYIEDDEGNIIESVRDCTIKGLQEIADIYTNGFVCVKF